MLQYRYITPRRLARSCCRIPVPSSLPYVPYRSMSLSGHLSPTAQAEQAVDLNLRLMRWRAAPQLDVGALARTKCLLLGGWVLGCTTQ